MAGVAQVSSRHARSVPPIDNRKLTNATAATDVTSTRYYDSPRSTHCSARAWCTQTRCTLAKSHMSTHTVQYTHTRRTIRALALPRATKARASYPRQRDDAWQPICLASHTSRSRPCDHGRVHQARHQARDGANLARFKCSHAPRGRAPANRAEHTHMSACRPYDTHPLHMRHHRRLSWNHRRSATRCCLPPKPLCPLASSPPCSSPAPSTARR